MNHNRSISYDWNSINIPRHLPSLSLGNAENYKLGSEIIPQWLLKREDFQRSLQKKSIIENYNLKRISPLTCNSPFEIKVIKHHLSQFFFLKEIWKQYKKRFMKICKIQIHQKGEKIIINKVFFIICGCVLIDDELRLGQYNIIGNNSEILKYIQFFKCEEITTVVTLEYEEFFHIFLTVSLKNFQNLKSEMSFFPYFSELSPNSCSEICKNLIFINYLREKSIYEIGNPSHYIYILLSGDIQICSLLTFKTYNKLPTGKRYKETVISEEKYAHLHTISQKFEIFGLKDVIDSNKRCSQAIVISKNVTVFALKWEIAERLFNDKCKALFLEKANNWKTKEILKNIKNRLIDKKKHFEALMAASEVRSKSFGREVFSKISKKKKLYIEGLEREQKNLGCDLMQYMSQK